MTNRRSDAIYFCLLAAVMGAGYLYANRSDDEVEALALPDFSPPPLHFEVPFELPFHVIEFESVAPPNLVLPSHMQTALVEVRTALLESSAVVEVRPEPPLLAAVD